MRIRRHSTSGFSLFELVLVIFIMGVISVVIGKILFQSYQSFLTSQDISEVDWSAFIALERIVNDIHRIRSANDITTIQSNQFTFTDDTGNSVQYTLSGNSLLRNSQTLANHIQSVTFNYLDKNGSTTATASAVRFIPLSITVAKGNTSSSFSTVGATRILS